MIPPLKDFSKNPAQKSQYFVQKIYGSSKPTSFEYSDVSSRLHETVPDKIMADPHALGTTTKLNSVFLESHKSYKKSKSLEDYPIKERQFARVSNFKLLASAKKLLASTPQNRVCICFSHRRDKDQNIFVTHNRKMGNSAFASYRNLDQCGDIHTCIMCNNRIMSKRGEKAAEAYDVWVHDRNNFVPMLTLTIPHYSYGDLNTQLKLIKKAFKRLMDDRIMRGFWSDMGRVGLVNVHEYTYGKNGHHNHIHAQPYLTKDIRKTQVATTLWTTPKRNGELRYLDDKQQQKLIGKGLQHTITYRSAEDFIKFYWRKLCVDVGLGAPSLKRGAKFTYGDKVKRYLAKAKSAQEITNSRAKKANNGNRTQWELLLDYGNGDSVAGDTFREYAAAFKGTQLLQFSKGLLHLLGLKTEQDEKDEAKQALAEGSVDESANDLREITPAIWKLIKIYHKQADVLTAVENDYLNETNEYDELISKLVVRYREYQMRMQFSQAAERGLSMKDMRPPPWLGENYLAS